MIAVREDIQRSIIPIRRIEVFLAQDIEGRALGEQCQAAGEPASDEHRICNGAWGGGGW